MAVPKIPESMSIRQFIHDVVETDKPLIRMGFDPSTERGARMTAYRMRTRWLARGWDIPAVVKVTVRGQTNTIGVKAHRDIYGPQLLMRAARRVRPDEACEIKEVMKSEMECWL